MYCLLLLMKVLSSGLHRNKGLHKAEFKQRAKDSSRLLIFMCENVWLYVKESRPTEGERKWPLILMHKFSLLLSLLPYMWVFCVSWYCEKSSQKSNERLMAGIIKGRQKGKAEERPKAAQPAGIKRRERASPSCW